MAAAGLSMLLKVKKDPPMKQIESRLVVYITLTTSFWRRRLDNRSSFLWRGDVRLPLEGEGEEECESEGDGEAEGEEEPLSDMSDNTQLSTPPGKSLRVSD